MDPNNPLNQPTSQSRVSPRVADGSYPNIPVVSSAEPNGNPFNTAPVPVSNNEVSPITPTSPTLSPVRPQVSGAPDDAVAGQAAVAAQQQPAVPFGSPTTTQQPPVAAPNTAVTAANDMAPNASQMTPVGNVAVFPSANGSTGAMGSIAGGSGSTFGFNSPASPNNVGRRNSSNAMKIGIIVGASVLVVAIIILVVFLVLRSGKINSPTEFANAVMNQKAVNCTVTQNDDSVVIQANDGWSKYRMDSGDTHIMYLEDDGYMYSWNKSSGYKTKVSKDDMKSMFDSISSSAKEEGNSGKYEMTDGTTLKCESNSKADFSKPSDVDFKDYSSALNAE